LLFAASFPSVILSCWIPTCACALSFSSHNTYQTSAASYNGSHIHKKVCA
jgi:hypothetical protein